MYMTAQKLLDLTSYIEASKVVDLANYYESITNLYSQDGKYYAVAKDHDTFALLYNKAIFDQYGVDYPADDWTWEDYKAAAEAITTASGGKIKFVYCEGEFKNAKDYLYGRGLYGFRQERAGRRHDDAGAGGEHHCAV